MTKSLTEIIRAVRVPDNTPLTKQAAAMVAMREWQWSPTSGEDPIWLNVAALAIAMRGHVRPLQLRRSVSRLVHGTDCHALPDAPPKLLRAPFIVEAAKPLQGETLFGDTISLGCYPLDGALFVIGVGYPDGAMVTRWDPKWGESAAVDTSAELLAGTDRAAWSQWATEATRYLILLGAILEAEASPVEQVRERDYTRVRLRDGDNAQITDDYEASVLVRGHLKRQPYGPANALRRWQWVAEYSARRWLAPKSIRIRS